GTSAPSDQVPWRCPSRSRRNSTLHILRVTEPSCSGCAEVGPVQQCSDFQGVGGRSPPCATTKVNQQPRLSDAKPDTVVASLPQCSRTTAALADRGCGQYPV